MEIRAQGETKADVTSARALHGKSQAASASQGMKNIFLYSIVLMAVLLQASFMQAFADGLLQAPSGFYAIPTRDSYVLGETVLISVKPPGPDSSLEIQIGGQSYVMLGASDELVPYIPGQLGNYSVRLFDSGQQLLFESSFLVENILPQEEKSAEEPGQSIIQEIGNSQEQGEIISLPGANDSRNITESSYETQGQAQGLQGQDSPIKSDRMQYLVGDTVVISISSQEPELQVSVSDGDFEYWFLGMPGESLSFVPKSAGQYLLSLYNLENNLLGEASFQVFEANELNSPGVPSGPGLFYIGQNGSSLPSNGSSPPDDNMPISRTEGRKSFGSKSFFLEDSKGNTSADFSIAFFIGNSSLISPEGPDFLDIEVQARVPRMGKVRLNNVKSANVSEFGLRIEEIPVPEAREMLNRSSAVLGSFAIDPTNLDFSGGFFEFTAAGTELWKCRLWNYSLQACMGEWELFQNLTPGMAYLFPITPEDPAYVETVNAAGAIDIDIAALDNHTIVVAWVSAATFTASYEIWDTNGTRLVDQTDLDNTGDSSTRVSVAAINTTNFVAAITDGPLDDLAIFGYDRNGNIVFARATVDSNIGQFTDTDLCQIGDRFVIADANNADNDADFYIYYNNGTNAVAESSVSGNIAPGALGQNLVSCARLNSTHFSYAFFDDNQNDASVAIRDYSTVGTINIATLDLDTDVGETGQIASAPLGDNRYAVIYYDLTATNITLAIQQYTNSFSTIYHATLEPDPGASSRVDIAPIKSDDQYFVVAAWMDTTDNTLRAGVYNASGSEVTSPFNITNSTYLPYPVFSVEGNYPGFDSGLCNGTFAIAYSNRTNNTVFETYWYNGTKWNGICPDSQPPVVTLLDPANKSYVFSNIIDFNFSVIDNWDSHLRDCTLYGNFTGAWRSNSTVSSVQQSFEVNITNNVYGDASYAWSILCADNYNNLAFGQNFTFILDTEGPAISSPLINVTIINQSKHIRFNVSAIDVHGVNVTLAEIEFPDLSKLNLSLERAGNEFYVVFIQTNQTGRYNFTRVWANDSGGLPNFVALDSQWFDVIVSPPSIFSLLSPQNATESALLTPTMAWQQVLEEDFGNYTLIIDNDQDFGSPDFTYYTYGISSTSKLVDFALDANAAYYWLVTAADIFGNKRNSTEYFTYITDTIPPSASIYSPAGYEYRSLNPATFNFTASDSNTLQACEFWENSTGAWRRNATIFPFDEGAPYLANLTFPEGHFAWNARCNDTAGNAGFSSANGTLIVDLTGPNITLLAPAQAALENTTNNVRFTVNVSDFLSNASACELIVDNSSVLVEPSVSDGVPFNFTKFLLNGNYTWSVNCSDLQGTVSVSEARNLQVKVIDSNPPLITHNYPTQNAYLNSINITLNYTVEDATGIENCSLWLDGGLNASDYNVENFVPNYFNLSYLSPGTYGWQVECYDNSTEYNHRTSTAWNFTIDTDFPQVYLHSPNASYSPPLAVFNYSAVDDSLYSCVLFGNFSGGWEPQGPIAYPPSGVYSNFTASLQDGEYIWNVNCTNLAGTSNFSAYNLTFRVDTQAPLYSSSISLPVSPAAYSPVTVHYFNITWLDNFNVSTVFFESNFSGDYENISASGSEGNYSHQVSSLAAGIYAFKWHAFDSNNNYNYTSEETYIVEAAASQLFLYINDTQNNYSASQGSDINLTAILSTPIFGHVLLYVNSTYYGNGTGRIENVSTFSKPGLFNITAYYEGNQNYSYANVTHYISISDIFNPVVYLSQPPNNSLVSTGFTSFQFLVIDDSPILNCTFYLNGSEADVMYDVQVNTTEAFSASLPAGNKNWSILCYDYANNSAQSHIYNFTAVSANATKVFFNMLDYYGRGDIAQIIVNTTDYFNFNVNATVNFDIIHGLTQDSWWNDSFPRRREILLSQNSTSQRQAELDVNITGLSGNISNCDEIRIARSNEYSATEVPFQAVSGDDANYCAVRFSAEVPSTAVNSTGYYAYFGNQGASDASGSPAPLGIRAKRGGINGATASLFANIDSIQSSKSFLLFTSRSASNTPAAGQWTGYINSDTQVAFDRYTAGTAAFVQWQVVEGSDISSQRSSASFAANVNQTNVSINGVNLTNSFIIVTGRANSATAGAQINGLINARFINSTAIMLNRNSSAVAATANWEVVSWNNSRVQNGSILLSTQTANATISPIDLNRTIIIFSTAATGSTTANAIYVNANFTNSTTATFARAAATGVVHIEYFVIELPPYFSVQKSTTLNTADTNILVTPVNDRLAFHTQSWSFSTATTTYQRAYLTVNLTNSSVLQLERQTATNTLLVNWFLVEQDPASAESGAFHSLMLKNTSDTGDLGLWLQEWNTFNKSLGNYSAVAIATRVGFNSGQNYRYFHINPDTTPPNVTLHSPPDSVGFGVGYFNFSYTPSDPNLDNCTLSLKVGNVLVPNSTNSSPENGQVNYFGPFYFGVGIHIWNVLCYDYDGNPGYAPANFTLNVTGPDLSLSAESIFVTNETPAEGANITIFANISNIGLTDLLSPVTVQFFRGNPYSGGTQINGNQTIPSLLIGENITVNVTYIVQAMGNDLFVIVDYANQTNESDKSNNMANLSLSVAIYQTYAGKTNLVIALGVGQGSTIYSVVENLTLQGFLFAADADSDFEFSNLQALTRASTNASTANDFTDLDALLGTLGRQDSVRSIWGGGSDTPLQTRTFNISTGRVDNVPIANSTNSSTFMTGILWDKADDTSFNQQYDQVDAEDIIFITEISPQSGGQFGLYDYELKVPAVLRDYKPGTSQVMLYIDLN